MFSSKASSIWRRSLTEVLLIYIRKNTLSLRLHLRSTLRILSLERLGAAPRSRQCSISIGRKQRGYADGTEEDAGRSLTTRRGGDTGGEVDGVRFVGTGDTSRVSCALSAARSKEPTAIIRNAIIPTLYCTRSPRDLTSPLWLISSAFS